MCESMSHNMRASEETQVPSNEAAMEALRKHRYFGVIEERLLAGAPTTVVAKSLHLGRILAALGIDIDTFSQSSDPATKVSVEIELKALVLAYFVLVFQGSETDKLKDTGKLLASCDVFKDDYMLVEILGVSNIPLEGNPFKNPEDISDAEWDSLLQFAHYIKYCEELLRKSPNKVISMRVAALLTGFDKCMIGNWKALGVEVKRRHAIFHFITKKRRTERGSKKRELEDEDEPQRKVARTGDVHHPLGNNR